jgi:hypothetical protein
MGGPQLPNCSVGGIPEQQQQDDVGAAGVVGAAHVVPQVPEEDAADDGLATGYGDNYA